MAETAKGPAKTPAHEMSREAANALLRAADSGQPLSEGALQEELGVGHDDLMGILDQLRETGQASQVAPGMWSGPDQDTATGEQPRVEVAVGGADEEPEGPAEETGPAIEWPPEFAPQPTVRLTRAIALTLSDEALGQLVKAGMGDDEESVFVLEVVP